MKKTIISLAFASLLMPSVGVAQEVDLNQEPIKDLYFDWVGAAPSNNQVGVYRDITYWNLFAMRQKGWNGGNGCKSLPLPDGNVLWTFADSYFGRISEFRDRKQYNNRPHNAAQVQLQMREHYGEDDFLTLNEYISTSQNYPMYYYKGKDWVRHPEAKLSQELIDEGYIDDAHYLKPEDGTLIKSSGEPRLQQIFASYNKDGERDGTYIVEFGIQGEPAQEGYIMELAKVKMPYVADYGHAVLEDGGHNYLYGTVRASTTSSNYWVVCARTQGRSLFTPWEYYIKNEDGEYSWQTELPTLEQVRKSKITGVSRAYNPSVFKYAGRYYMLSQAGPGGNIQISEGENPWGPFKVQKVIYSVRKDEAVANGVFVHPQLSRMGELVLSYTTDPEAITIYSKGANGEAISTNLDTDQRNRYGWGSASLNQPHFLRVFNWQNIYGIENVGVLQDAGLQEWDTVDMIEDIAAGGEQFKVYPVSVSTTFSIDTNENKSYDWSVVSAEGSTVMTGTSTGNALINVSSLSSGMYVVIIESGSIRKSAKIIKR